MIAEASRLRRWARIANELRILRGYKSVVSFRRARYGAPPGLEHVRIRALAGAGIQIRRGTSDAQVVWDAFVRGYHLVELERPRLILDLGANIGVTMAHMAVLYASARVVGVEMVPEHARLARRNTSPWADRCEVVEAAVWNEPGSLGWALEPGNEFGAAVKPGSAVRAITLSQLIGDSQVDYMKMDIEGAERTVLTSNTGWAAKVAAIKVEVHPPYSIAQCASDLSSLGFRPLATPDGHHVIGRRG